MSEPNPAAPQPSDRPSGIERRLAPRFDCALDFSFFLTAAVDGDAWLARVRNLSVGGMSLICGRPFEPDSLLAVQLRNDSGNYSRMVQLRVIYCLERPNGDCVLGGAFTEKLSGEELQALLAREQ
jgi:hypothetical protein